MDQATSDFYDYYASDGAIRTEAPQSAIPRYFELAFKEGSKIQDVGSGSRRDLAVLCKRGFDAYGIEPNESMRAFALQNHLELAARLRPGSLPITGAPFGGHFDGVVCRAVMMHCFREWEPVVFDIPEDIAALLSHREQARTEKNWARADAIRKTLNGLGWSVEDTKEGQTITRISVDPDASRNA
ncbi:class I SAM-dependent methyltransferase [Massilia niabensis]|uniref:Methyltransferase domain-containing protein n=1 Tax=Massilia niabensis TaxID=544910 RepID=A0ABW0LAD8_9BURK